jgi:hypothetical protein
MSISVITSSAIVLVIICDIKAYMSDNVSKYKFKVYIYQDKAHYLQGLPGWFVYTDTLSDNARHFAGNPRISNHDTFSCKST